MHFSPDRTLRYDLLQSEEYMRLAAQPSLFREEVLARNPQIHHVFVDEVQKIPALLDEVHLLSERKNPPQFILTGSSARKLKRSQANLLAGRAFTLHLFPLTHMELGEAFDLRKALEVGTLPKIYLESDRAAADQYLRSYVETYLKEEIEAEALVRNIGTFLRFLSCSGHENGNLLNFSSIARETGTKHPTVKEYFRILEDTLIGRFLFPFHRSKRKRLAQRPKFYFFDTGVQRAITKKLTVPLEPATPEHGNLFETWVINEMLRLDSYFNLDFEFSFFRTERGAEVDLVIEHPRGKRLAVEIKSSENPHPMEFRSGFEAFKTIDQKAARICVCRTLHARKWEDIEILPWREFFQFIRTW